MTNVHGPGESVRLLLQENGTLTDASANLPKVVALQHGIAAGPFSGPGHVDALIATQPGVHHVDPYFLINDGKGHFTKSTLPDRFPADSLRYWEPSADNARYNTMRVADVDGDGHPDILLAVSGDAPKNKYRRFNNSRILFNDGSDHWDEKHVFEFPAGAWGRQTHTTDFAVADVNGDGLPDILVSTDKTGSPFWKGMRLRLFLNQGNRKFVEAKDAFQWDQGQWDNGLNIMPIHVFLRDINADGYPDVIVSTLSTIRRNKPEPYLLAINDEHGHFIPLDPTNMGSADRGSHLWPADVTGTGRPDLLGLTVTGVPSGKQYLNTGVSIDLYENIPGGGAKIAATHTTEQNSGSHGNWVNSHLVTIITGATKGRDQADFNVSGDISPNGDFSDLQIVFNPPLGKKIPAALAKCGGPAPTKFDDGQYRAVLGFQKAGNTWVAQDAACHMKNSSRLDALMMRFVLASFREIAGDMVTLGNIKSVQSVVFQNWLKRVAAGDIVISETVPAGVKIPTTSTTEEFSGSHGNWVNSNLFTTIKDAKKGQDKVDFNVKGNVYDGDFVDLQIVFNPPLGTTLPIALGGCAGPGPVQYDDKQYRAVIGFRKDGKDWVAKDADCVAKNSPPLDAFMMKYATTSFRDVAADMVTSGNISTVKSTVFQDWLKKVAAGDIVIR